jgi:4-carboxymuconolactone decarboxylase
MRWRAAERTEETRHARYGRAVKALGHVGITDVITLMGYYTSVSMTLAFLRRPRRRAGMPR